MKYLVFIALFVVGGLAGYWIGVYQPTQEPEQITEVIYETNDGDKSEKNHHKKVDVSDGNLLDTTSFEIDTLTEVFELDTLSEEMDTEDTTQTEEELFIRRDELLASRRIPIIYLENQVENDSLIKEMLGIKDNLPKDMLVQFWLSPIGFTGYKLSKNTLILYGVSDQIKYKIYQKKQFHYLSGEEIFYVLKETNDFLPFQEVKRSTVLDD